MAGAVAGAVSRTGTAPLDRMKVFMQVRYVVNIGFVSVYFGMSHKVNGSVVV